MPQLGAPACWLPLKLDTVAYARVPDQSEKPGKDDDEEDDKSEEQKQKEKEDKPDDVFDSRYWGPLLVKRFDAGGESFGFLLVGLNTMLGV